MKIIHILNYSWENGGSSKVVYDLAKRQEKEGFEVSIFSIDKVGHKPYLAIPGVEIVLIRPHFLAKVLPLFSLELYKVLKNRYFDLIHLHGLWNFTLLATFVLGLSGKAMLTVHGCLNPFTFKGNFLKRGLFSYSFQKRFLKNIKMIHVFHEKEKEYVENYIGQHSNIQVLANGIAVASDSKENTARFLSGKVLFLSRLDHIKGLDLLLPAFLKVLEVYPSAVLQIAGPDFGMLGFVEQFIKTHNVAHAIHYLGVLTGEAKQQAQDNANVFVLPSYSEGFSIAVLEALNEGIPVVVSTETGLSNEITTHNAGIVVQFEIESLSNGILETLNNPSEAAKKVKNAQDMLKERFDIQIILDKMMKLNYQFDKK